MNIYKTKLFAHIIGDSLVGKTVNLTIAKMSAKNLPNRTGQTEEKYLLHFKETEKTLILNQVNARTIAILHGSETEDWSGKQITLYSEEVMAFGKTHNAIRIAPAIPNGNGNMPQKEAIEAAALESEPPAAPDTEDNF